MAENMQHVFDVEEERIFKTSLTVAQSGYYRVCVRYAHSNWDAWLKMDVVGEKGESLTYVPPLPNKYTETTMLIYLFAGVNRISMAPRFDQPVDIQEILILEKALELKPYTIPSGDWFYIAEPRTRRVVVVSYTGAPWKITAGDREIPFELEDKALYDHADPVETQEPHNYYHIKLHQRPCPAWEKGRISLWSTCPKTRRFLMR